MRGEAAAFNSSATVEHETVQHCYCGHVLTWHEYSRMRVGRCRCCGLRRQMAKSLDTHHALRVSKGQARAWDG